MTEDYGQIVRDVVDVVWSQGQVDRIPEFYTEDFTCHQPKQKINWVGATKRLTWEGHDGVREVVETVRAAFPDYTESPEHVVVEGDMVAMRMINRGTHTGVAVGSFEATGRSFEAIDTMFVRMKGGRIAEQWGMIDQFAAAVELGFIDKTGVHVSMSGPSTA
ncbi:ester cyclase [Brevibacterium senegalense]|uniref:ester cyclase n=1 Tax=Brevibacterium senegalense TaxID=1033736 RepID=UPI0002FC5750|nr:ester cyclase [Brevibacterium senegalense]